MATEINLRQTRDTASTLRKQGKYEEALELYGILWRDHRAECNEWDGWGYAFCLRKLDRAQEALEICREVYKAKPDWSNIRDLYGWCIYDLHIASLTDEQIEKNEAEFLRAAEAIVKLTAPGQYSPYVRTVFRVVEYCKSRATYPADRILAWTDKLKPEQLSSEASSGTDDGGKKVEYASDREKWFAERGKALFERQRFQECIACCEAALSQFARFHHDNDVWFKWRIALSMAALGDKAQAIRLLRALLSRKKDWFIQHRLAQILFQEGQLDEAFPYALDAALNAGDLEYKWELFLLMGQLLQAQSKLEEARKHVLLAVKLRQDREWKIPHNLSQIAQQLHVDTAAPVSVNDLHRELRETWKVLKRSGQPQYQGLIVNYFPEKKSGFIRDEKGTKYYFKAREFQGPRSQLQLNLRVKFLVEKSPEPGKKDIAVFIEAVRS